MELAGAVLTLAGSVFLFLGALGLLRMPDIYNRMQAGTKATTLGSILFLTGLALYQWGSGSVQKTAVLILFIVFTNPLSSHTLARASHAVGIPLTGRSAIDRLADSGKNT